MNEKSKRISIFIIAVLVFANTGCTTIKPAH